MNRRSLLKWISRAVGWVCAGIVAIPGLSFITAPLRRRARKGVTQRVAPLANLRAGVPVQAAVTGSRQDAWFHYDREIVGRIWLLRESDESVAPQDTNVKVFSAICPHLGCTVGFDRDGQTFNCPCHKAFFRISGEPVGDKELGYHNPTPRNLDLLDSRVVQDEQSGEWWVEVDYQKFEHGLTKQVPRV